MPLLRSQLLARRLSLLHPQRNAVHGRLYNVSSSSRFKILFMGRDEFSCLVFRELHAARVVPSQLPDPFSIVGAPPENHVVVTASFGRILTSSMLDMFAPNRRLNLHPSLLPAYRGPAPIQHAILNGDKETGVSVIEMLKWKEGIDAGSIWGTSRVPIHDGAMFPEMRDTLGYVAGRLLVSVLRDMRVGKAKAEPQASADSAPHASTISVLDSAVSFTTMSAESIVRRHRAISHQRPLITCISSEKTVQLHSPYVLDSSVSALSSVPGTATFQKSTRTLVVRCADGSVLSVPLMKQEGKALMEAKDWWNGAKGLGLVHDGELRFLDEFSHILS
ncbi:hypothetical protein DXG03_002420 [Asterophora parasitica]|uniref:Methionyl-tRNA formyltransferase n=1 Tax=Asterophora parasitica TaxID=117018 RepID=A0A9P7KDN6_9AGAR|nr:hypothetical protein DXG03_002420 [Asterophora parasitica]